MLFNSYQYLLFLPVVYLVFYFAPQQMRWAVLLIASFLFYATFKASGVLCALCLVIVITYTIGRGLAAAKSKRPWLWAGIMLNLSVLFVMRYLPLFYQPLNGLIAVGVSYYVFQAISYLIDIDLEIVQPQRHLGYLALYLSFFPKLLQGPIERGGDLLPQLKTPYVFNYDNMRTGLLLLTWGLFKKVVLADRISPYVNWVYGSVHHFTGLSLILATYAYGFELYFDFSGYTDMALGAARLFNINLTQNFQQPFLSTSVADFWRRWHISLSRWILDYIFKPLQMRWRQWGDWGTATALMVTFLTVGLWHGATWGFAIFGLIHGLYLSCSVFYRPFQKQWHKALHLEKSRLLKGFRIFVTFNLFCFAWIFFRASNLGDAIYIATHLFQHWRPHDIWDYLMFQHLAKLSTVMAAALLYTVVANNITKAKGFFLKNMVFRWAVYYGLVFYIIVFAVREKSSFIYMGF